MNNKVTATMFRVIAETRQLQRSARALRWAAASAALAAVLAGCGGGDSPSSSEAQAQRDQTAAAVQVQQSVAALMSAVIQPGSGTENFEAGMGDWQNWGNAQVVAGAGVSGSSALQVGASAGGAALKVPNVAGGTTYRLAAQVRATDPVQGPTTLGVDFYDAAGHRIIGTRAPSNVTSASFAPFSYEVTTPAGTASALAWVWKNGSTGLAYVDDVTFGPASAPPPPPPPPAEGNLVSNGGFEAGMTGWTDWGNTQIVSGQSNSGTSALSVGTAAGGAGYVVDTIVPGSNYRLGVSAKVSDASDKVYVGVNFVDAAGSLVTSTQRNTASTTYTTLSADSIAPAGAVRAVVYVWKDAGSGTAYVDDFSFGATSGSTPPPPAGPNLLLNGSFENALASWVNWGNAVSTSQAAAGTSAAQVGSAAGGLGQSVTGIVPGNTYRASAQAKVTSSDETGYLGLKFVDAAGNSLQDAVVTISSTSYASSQVELVAPPNASSALVYVWKNAGSGFALVDEVVLNTVTAESPPTEILQPGELAPFALRTLSSAGTGFGRRITAAARLTGGGAVVVWRSGTALLQQRLDAAGQSVGAAQVVGTTGPFSVSGTADGGWVIALSTPERILVLQRFDASGALVGTAAPVDAAPGGFNVRVRALADGGFVVSWVADLGSGTRAFLRRFDAAGTSVTNRIAASSAPGSEGRQTAVQITPLPDGTFYAGWVQVPAAGGPATIVARQFDANLNPMGEEHVIGIAREAAVSPDEVAAVSLSNGGVLFAWALNNTSAQTEIRWQVIQALGTPQIPVPSAAGVAQFANQQLSSVEAVAAAGGNFRIVVESVVGFSRGTDAFTTVVEVGTRGELLGRTNVGSRSLASVSPTTGAFCSSNTTPGVGASGGEDGRYLLAETACGGLVLVEAR